jgi:hypothetical protein
LSYFDHVRCHACKAMLDPETLASTPGQGLTCPKCKAALSLTDLFGLADAFAEEEEGPVSLDDLVSGPRPTPQATSRKPASKPSARRPAAPPAPKGSTALVRRASDDADAGPDPDSEALHAMRSLKRKKK